jgi:1,4-alpha-glucan branching enzyme
MPLIGAVLRGAGSLVRVFASNASSLRVYGDWNGWDEATAVDLAVAGGGFWEGHVAGLIADGRYELLVGQGATSVNHRLDPAARDTDDSSLDNWHNRGGRSSAESGWRRDRAGRRELSGV